jgi:hypothetical protein
MSEATAKKGQDQSQNQSQWLKNMMKLKQRFVDEPDSIVLFVFGGARGSKFLKTFLNLDVAVNELKRNAVFVVPIAEVKGYLEELKGIADELWGVVKRYVPRLYDFKPERWRMLNDTIAEKRLLIQRKNTWCLFPRCEETGQIATAMKVIHKASIEYQQSDFSTYEQLITDYLAIQDKMSELNDRVRKTIISYQNKKASSQGNKKPDTTKSQNKTATATPQPAGSSNGDSGSNGDGAVMETVEALTASLLDTTGPAEAESAVKTEKKTRKQSS